jgi:hypothetical protein
MINFQLQVSHQYGYLEVETCHSKLCDGTALVVDNKIGCVCRWLLFIDFIVACCWSSFRQSAVLDTADKLSVGLGGTPWRCAGCVDVNIHLLLTLSPDDQLHSSATTLVRVHPVCIELEAIWKPKLVWIWQQVKKNSLQGSNWSNRMYENDGCVEEFPLIFLFFYLNHVMRIVDDTLETARQEMAVLDSNMFTIYLSGLSKTTKILIPYLKQTLLGSEVLKFLIQISLFNYDYFCCTWTFVRCQ